jgi:hypothetical protein
VLFRSFIDDYDYGGVSGYDMVLTLAAATLDGDGGSYVRYDLAYLGDLRYENEPLGRLTVNGYQPTGGLSAPLYSYMSFRVDLTYYDAPSTADDRQSHEVNPMIASPTLSITVVPYDDAGGGDNLDDRGGTCDALGLGALALLIPLAFSRKKIRR